MEKTERDETGKTEDVQKVEVAQQPAVKASVMDYDTPGLVVGSAKRKQEAAEEQAKANVAASVEKEEVVNEPGNNEPSEEHEEVTFDEDIFGRFTIKYALINPLLGFARDLRRPEVEVVFGEKGMSARFVDPAHVAIGSFLISRDEFTQYLRKDNKEWKVGIDARKILGLRIRARDEIGIVLRGTPLNVGEGVQRYCIKHSEAETTFKGLTEDDGARIPKMPKIDFRNSVLLRSEKVWSFLKAVEQVSDAFRVILNKEGLKLRCKTDETTIETNIPEGGITIEMTDAETASVYPMDWVMSAFKNLKDADEIKISLGSNDYPMQIDFLIGMRKMDDSVASLLVAPRVG